MSRGSSDNVGVMAGIEGSNGSVFIVVDGDAAVIETDAAGLTGGSSLAGWDWLQPTQRKIATIERNMLGAGPRRAYAWCRCCSIVSYSRLVMGSA